jgi:hypothetical protein
MQVNDACAMGIVVIAIDFPGHARHLRRAGGVAHGLFTRCDPVHNVAHRNGVRCCHQIGRTAMKTTLWKRRDAALVVGAAITALIIGVLTMAFAKADTFTSAGLGSEWTCYKLPYMMICDHTAQRKSPS